jgi:hypothetical protein
MAASPARLSGPAQQQAAAAGKDLIWHNAEWYIHCRALISHSLTLFVSQHTPITGTPPPAASKCSRLPNLVCVPAPMVPSYWAHYNSESSLIPQTPLSSSLKQLRYVVLP